jgi:hypothetical protein
MAVDDLESGDESFAPFLIEGANRGPQAFDRLSQVVRLGNELVAARQDLDEFVVSAQVDRTEPFALLAQILELAFDLDAAGQRLIGFMIGKRGEARRLASSLAIACLSSSSRTRAPSRRSSEAARCSRAALIASSA